jgi:hypothetical protein
MFDGEKVTKIYSMEIDGHNYQYNEKSEELTEKGFISDLSYFRVWKKEEARNRDFKRNLKELFFDDAHVDEDNSKLFLDFCLEKNGLIFMRLLKLIDFRYLVDTYTVLQLINFTSFDESLNNP